MATYNVDLQDDQGNSYRTMANPDSKAEFTEATSRENINSGETHRTIFGKLRKFLSDLGAAAYIAIANNCTTTAAGFALDARQGKVLMDKSNQISSDLGGCQFGITTDGKPGYKKVGADTVYPFKSDFAVAKLGDITTPTGSLNLSTYPGFQNFEINKNIFLITTQAMGIGRGGMDGTYYAYCQPSVSYASDTGVLSVSGLRNDEPHGVGVNCQVAVYLAYMPN